MDMETLMGILVKRALEKLKANQETTDNQK